MTILEAGPEVFESNIDPVNPYGLMLEGAEVKQAMDGLLTESPYIDKLTNPDIDNFAVFKIPANHPAAVIPRSIEGMVIAEDWLLDADTSKEKAQSYEENSLFFLVVDMGHPEGPKPAASLRIADCLLGGSETVEYFKEEFGAEMPVPPDYIVTDVDKERGMWDIVGVMADRKYRKGIASVWAYYALYKASQEMGVHKWISNINDKEFKNLDSLGIPFKLLENVPKVIAKEGKPIAFGFYVIDVDQIRPEMTEKIKELENATEHKGINDFISKLSRIAMSGSMSA